MVPRLAEETGQPIPIHLPPAPKPATGEEEQTSPRGNSGPYLGVPGIKILIWLSACWHPAVSEMFWSNHLAHRLTHQEDIAPCRCLRHPRAASMVLNTLNTHVSNYIKPKRTLVADSLLLTNCLGSLSNGGRSPLSPL